jgi:hypothetical protein
MKRLVPVLFAMAGLFLLPEPEAHADPGKARACLDELITGSIASGWRLRALDADSAAPQEAVTYRLTLYRGNTYLLVACADGEKVDLDIRLYDPSGTLADNDKSPDPAPFVSSVPTTTGEYALQVLVYKSDLPKTDFAVAVAYQASGGAPAGTTP